QSNSPRQVASGVSDITNDSGTGKKLRCHLFGICRVSPDYKPFSCDTCHKRFARLTYLTKHRNAIHLNRRYYQCDLCSKLLKSQASLEAHKRIHSREKLFPCEICNKNFTRSSGLNQHMNSHTTKNYHSCNICKKRFSRKPILTKHMKSIHKMQPHL
ncbi:MAG: C2H2-type zinc finger protein, partial [Endozoicomonadaceae bacterium]|nr:C2H2-type zinc finger protein [Endozoicomonadaceae bacterium]